MCPRADDVFGMTPALSLVSWWAGPDGAAGARLARLRAALADVNGALIGAAARQADSIAALNADLLEIAHRAALARDAQAYLDIELEIAARMRACALQCSEGWAEAILGQSAARVRTCDEAAAQILCA